MLPNKSHLLDMVIQRGHVDVHFPIPGSQHLEHVSHHVDHVEQMESARPHDVELVESSLGDFAENTSHHILRTEK